MKSKLFYSLTVVSVVLFSLASCVDERYEISKDNLNLEMNLFQDGLEMPLGKIEKVSVGDLFSQVYPEFNDYLQESTGEYAFGMNTSFDFSNPFDMSAITDISDIEVRQDIPFMFKSGTGTTVETVQTRSASDMITVNAPAMEEYTADVDEGFEIVVFKAGSFPEEVVALESIVLDDVTLNINVNNKNGIDLTKVGMILDVKVILPDMMVVDEKNLDENGYLRIEGRLSEDGNVIVEPIKLKSLNLTGYDITQDIVGVFMVKGLVGVVGYPEDVDKLLDRVHELELEMTITDIKVTNVVAKIESATIQDPVEQMIDLSGVTSALNSGDGMTLDFSHVHLTVDFETNNDAVVFAEVELIPYYGGTPDESKTQHVVLDVTHSGITRFWLEEQNTCCPEGYTFKEVDLKSMLTPAFPDQILVRVTGGLAPDQVCTFNVSEPYTFAAECSLDVPFKFGEKLLLQFNRVFEVDPAMVSMILESGSLVLTGKVESTLPFNLDLETRFLDKDNNIVPLQQGSGTSEIFGSTDGEPVITDLELSFAKDEAVSVSDVTAIELVFTIKSAGSDVSLTADQYIAIDLQLAIPEGITVDLNDFLN